MHRNIIHNKEILHNLSFHLPIFLKLHVREHLEIISDEITYKDGELNIKLKPVFQSLVENQYISALKNDSNRSAETGIIKGSEAPLDPQNVKNSPGCANSEANWLDLYDKIIDINNFKAFRLLERFHAAA